MISPISIDIVASIIDDVVIVTNKIICIESKYSGVKSIGHSIGKW